MRNSTLILSAVCFCLAVVCAWQQRQLTRLNGELGYLYNEFFELTDKINSDQNNLKLDIDFLKTDMRQVKKDIQSLDFQIKLKCNNMPFY